MQSRLAARLVGVAIIAAATYGISYDFPYATAQQTQSYKKVKFRDLQLDAASMNGHHIEIEALLYGSGDSPYAEIYDSTKSSWRPGEGQIRAVKKFQSRSDREYVLDNCTIPKVCVVTFRGKVEIKSGYTFIELNEIIKR